MENENWRQDAACLEEDPDLFFPVGSTGPALLQVTEAKAVCGRCLVREQCLEWAMELDQDFGVWGGLDENERRALKRRTARRQSRARSTFGRAVGPSPEAVPGPTSGPTSGRTWFAPPPTHGSVPGSSAGPT